MVRPRAKWVHLASGLTRAELLGGFDHRRSVVFEVFESVREGFEPVRF